MEENYRILSAARDETGKPFRIVRVPVPDLMTATVSYDSLSRLEFDALDTPRGVADQRSIGSRTRGDP